MNSMGGSQKAATKLSGNWGVLKGDSVVDVKPVRSVPGSDEERLVEGGHGIRREDVFRVDVTKI